MITVKSIMSSHFMDVTITFVFCCHLRMLLSVASGRLWVDLRAAAARLAASAAAVAAGAAVAVAEEDMVGAALPP